MQARIVIMAALRAGYKLGAFNQLTLGAGIRYGNLNIDYAFAGYDELGGTHRISMLYSWGSPPVSMSVFPAVFSPNNDRYMDEAVFLPVFKTTDGLKAAKISIMDKTGVAVAELRVKGEGKSAGWDGTSAGITPADGVYTAVLSAEYESGFSKSEKVTVEIDNTPPASRVDAEPMFLRPGKSDALLIPATFTFFARDRNKVAKWQFLVWDRNKKVFCSISGTGEPPSSYIWDGRSPDGEYVETGEIYYHTLITHDSVGNKAQTKPQAQVMLLREIKLTFSSDALFDPGKADVKISAYEVLKGMRKIIEKHPDYEITVTGHTDSTQPGGTRYKNNTELSKARAEAVKFFMVNLLAQESARIRTEGHGEATPVASNDTEEGRIKNRRVEIMMKSTVYK